MFEQGRVKPSANASERRASTDARPRARVGRVAEMGEPRRTPNTGHAAHAERAEEAQAKFNDEALDRTQESRGAWDFGALPLHCATSARQCDRDEVAVDALGESFRVRRDIATRSGQRPGRLQLSAMRRNVSACGQHEAK